MFLLHAMKTILNYICAALLCCSIPLGCVLLVSRDLKATKKFEAEKAKSEQNKVYHIKVYHVKEPETITL